MLTIVGSVVSVGVYGIEFLEFGNKAVELKEIHVLAAPVHQMQQYYRLGVLDNCSEKWNALFDCLSLKTKRSSEMKEILETREKSKPHIWTFRTPEEASDHWNELFGHVNDPE
ncbi:uncharacterized protein LOC122665579 [Telopea speciosissima]|uniref:uncharacterized protein LOC122665579 n=1 Tax=Telopea speciosissima TaxID=54955 RepID=UPI001CC6DD80|nr:uncharacterized protein LOC122665579 [Telopea speciosissima]